jgi:hypothetical protein
MYFSKLKERHFDRISKPCPVKIFVAACDQGRISSLRGNAGAGGAMLALAADHVYARSGVVLNPHYRSMSDLYRSEYWTYTLPRPPDSGNCSRRPRRAASVTRDRGC